jgi:Putative DNA-binding domain
MSIFTKPLSQLNTTDLQELLDEVAVENARLEFKSELPTKDEILKKVSSFANTFDGFIVVGAKARGADGRIEDLPGVDTQAGYKQTIVQWSFGGASPPVTVEVSDPIAVPASNGRVCYVIYTGESDVAPHFLNGRKGIYIRTDEFSARFETHLADENELRHLLDRRKSIRGRRDDLQERARRRFKSYVANHKDRSGNSATRGSTIEFCVVPRFPARPVCEQGTLKQLVTDRRLIWRGDTFPDPSNNIVSQFESAIVLNPTRELSIFEVNLWGMLFYCTRIDGDHNGTLGIHLYQFVGTILLFTKHATDMLLAMGHSGPTLIKAKLSAIVGVRWLHAVRGFLEPRDGSPLDNDVEFSVSTTIEELGERPDGIVMDILKIIFFSVNWPDIVNRPQTLASLILKGYEYNGWAVPTELRLE